MSQPYRKYICKTCGLIYDEAEGDLDSGLAPGTRFEDIPDDWYCPLCLVSKSDFVLMEAVKKLDAAMPNVKTKVGGKDHIVIIGAGYAGWTVAEKIKAVNPQAHVSLITACDGSVYPKPALSMALSQGRNAEDLVEFSAQQKATELGIMIKARTKVISINRARKRLMTTTGTVEYSQLILAMGATSIKPHVIGTGVQDIMMINDLVSYKKFRKAIEGKQQISIIGGGLIAVELAEDLASSGYGVSLYVRGGQLMRTMLPGLVAERLSASLLKNAIKINYETQIDRVEKVDSGYCLVHDDGTVDATDLVIAAIGLKPNIALAEKSDLDCHQGIVVNAYMQTSDPDIFALGDCVEFEGEVQAYLEPIRRQAQTIASFINRDLTHKFELKPPLIKTKTPSLSIISCPPLKKDATGGWSNVELHGAIGMEVSYMVNSQPKGFVLSGELVSQAPHKYQALTA